MKSRTRWNLARTLGVCVVVLLPLSGGCQTEEHFPGSQLEDSKAADAERHFNRGNHYSMLGKYEEAIEAFKQAIRINPEHSRTHYNLGVVYAKLSRHSEAIEAFKRSVRINPNDASAHYNLGIIYVKLRRHNGAIEAFKETIRIRPDDALAYNNLGASYDELGRHNEAIKAFEQAIRINPNDASVHNNLGIMYAKVSRHNEAKQAFKRAISMNPNFAEAHHHLALAYLSLGERDAALEEYDILKGLDKDEASKLLDFIKSETRLVFKLDEETRIGILGREIGKDAQILIGTIDRAPMANMNFSGRLLVYKGNNVIKEIPVTVTATCDKAPGRTITFEGRTDSGKRFEVKETVRDDYQTEIISFVVDFDPLLE